MLIILAGALGAFALIVYLLFRRLRQLSWQLTQLRVERDCERLLRALGMGPEATPTEMEDAQERYFDETPVRSRGHLSLYLGGNVAAFLAGRRSQRHLATAAGTAVFAMAAAVAALITTPSTDIPGLPDTGPPGIHSPAHMSPGRSPTGMTGSSSAASPRPHLDSASTDNGLSVTGSNLTVSEPTGVVSPPASLRTPSPSGTSGSATPSPTQATMSQSPTASSSSLLDACAGVEPVVELRVCLGL